MELADAFWHAFGLCYAIYMTILGLLTVRSSSVLFTAAIRAGRNSLRNQREFPVTGGNRPVS